MGREMNDVVDVLYYTKKKMHSVDTKKIAFTEKK